MKTACMLVPLAALLLGNCVSPEHERQVAIDKARAHCAAEGKQFELVDSKVDTHFDVLTYGAEATVTAHCLGPGDPGYVPPSAGSKQ
jgi:hypothetical protein